tara:strand:- start:1023 stop:1781 length:759 start_codon:yes stop_codon:yes gene_type:complete
MDLKKVDKDGKPLNLTKQANRNEQADYYGYWLKDPQSLEPSQEDIKCELQLQALGDFEQLDLPLDAGLFHKEIKQYNDWFVPYLRRDNVSNDREGMLLVGLEGDKPNDSLSRPEAIKRAGRMLYESDFNVPTEAYEKLTSLHPILDYWGTLGRTMIIKCNQGGWFPPHRDSPYLARDTFRVITFLGNGSGMDNYEWWLGDERKTIVANRTYFVDTRKVHRTHSWADNSYHLILNVPKTWENVMKLMSVLNFY